jgi:lysophospholipase L1-like esterase
MKYIAVLLVGIFVCGIAPACGGKSPEALMPSPKMEKFFAADNPNFQYMGRVDISDPRIPRFWASGVVVRFRFRGASCQIIVHDQVPNDNTHNYVVLLLDQGSLGSYRVKLRGETDTLTVWSNGRARISDEELRNRAQTNLGSQAPDPRRICQVTLCKATEGIGWMELAGVLTDSLLPAPPLSDRKIECIGNSITCGAGSDTREIPCGKGQWYDQHNAWMSYGAQTARALKAQWHLTSVSGIGLIHSCCEMTITMPEVYDRMNCRGDEGNWDFGRYQPDVVTVCLGQNDGIQDSTAFCSAYVAFLGKVRRVNPKAQIVLLTSPMGNPQLTEVLKRYIGAVVAAGRRSGDKKLSDYFFSRQWSGGCGGHPDLADQGQIAEELTGYLRKLMGW